MLCWLRFATSCSEMILFLKEFFDLNFSPCLQHYWMPVLPNTQSDDSGLGTEDGLDYLHFDDYTHKRPQRWKGADEQGEYEVQSIVDYKFEVIFIPIQAI